MKDGDIICKRKIPLLIRIVGWLKGIKFGEVTFIYKKGEEK